MRIRSAALLALVATAACISNPDPRKRTLEAVQRDGAGGWIVVETRDGVVQGELIAVGPHHVHVFAWSPVTPRVVGIELARVRSAALYSYEAEGGFGAWGLAGVASTASHGLLLVFSAPIWILSAGTAAAVESRSVRIYARDDGWREVAKWARFPQGLPPGALVGGRFRARAAAPAPPRPARPDPRTAAWRLTQEAYRAAIAGDCARVRVLGAEVLQLHAAFHATVFVRDAAIARCLTASP